MHSKVSQRTKISRKRKVTSTIFVRRPLENGMTCKLQQGVDRNLPQRKQTKTLIEINEEALNSQLLDRTLEAQSLNEDQITIQTVLNTVKISLRVSLTSRQRTV